jgi:uncharacterized protein involved in exopolysaccharide biosynthesis
MTEPDVTDNRNATPATGLASEGYAVRVYPISEAEEIRLIDLWRVVWAGKWRITVASVIGAVLAVALSFLITPEYRSEAVISPVGSGGGGGPLASLAGQLGGLGSLVGLNFGVDDRTAESIAVLRSRSLTQRFIEKNALLPILFHEDWDEASKSWRVDDPEDVPNLWKAYERFDRKVRSVTQDADTGLVTLSIDWIDPLQARDWANGLVAEVNADMRSRAIEQSKNNIEFLRGQLQNTNEVELRTAAFGLMEAEMKNAMLSAVRTEYAFEVIDPAITPEKPSWPNRILLAALGFFAGFATGMFLVFLRRS